MYERVLREIGAGKKAAVVTLVALKGEQPSGELAIGSKRFRSGGSAHGSHGVGSLDDASDKIAEEAIFSRQLVDEEVPLHFEQKISCRLVAEPFFSPIKLIIFGGGTIADPLVKLSALLGYDVDVVDDRPEFANGERFPLARSVICGDFEDVIKKTTFNHGTSAVIITRGHQHDLKCLEMLVEHELDYLGVIGSKKKITMAKEYLRKSGVSEELIQGVFMPIGIDIGAQTPEEIAVSIAAEMVKVRRGGGAASLAEGLGGGTVKLRNSKTSDIAGLQSRSASSAGLPSSLDIALLERVVECRKNGTPVALATIIKASGSTPRKAGAKMLVFRNGGIYGTIGGGISEEKIRRKAVDIINGSPQGIMYFSLQGAEAAKAGMICGGDMEVFIEVLK